MKRKRAVHSSTTKSQRRRLEEIEKRLSLLLLLVQHNIDKLLDHHRTR